jgi:hypothetical protein
MYRGLLQSLGYSLLTVDLETLHACVPLYDCKELPCAVIILLHITCGEWAYHDFVITTDFVKYLMTWHKDVQEAKKEFSQFKDGDSVNECLDDEQEYWTIIGDNNKKTISKSNTKINKQPAEESSSEEEEVDYWDQYDVDVNKPV